MGNLRLDVEKLQEIYDHLKPVADNKLVDGDCSLEEKGLMQETGISFFLSELDVQEHPEEVGFTHKGFWYADLETLKIVYAKAVELDRADGSFDGKLSLASEEPIEIKVDTNSVDWNSVINPYLKSIFAIKKYGLNGFSGQGTAWVIQSVRLPDGKTRHYCITNAHVVDKAKEQEVKYGFEVIRTVDGEEKKVEVPGIIVGADHTYDIAVVYFDSEEEYTSLPVDPEAEINVDDPINVVGNQKGYGVRPNPGNIISTESYTTYSMRLIQDNSQALPGNSGSPTFNREGKVIGVTNSGPEAGGANFNIPISYALDSFHKIMKEGFAVHGYDGFMWQHFETDALKAMGADTATYPFALRVLEIQTPGLVDGHLKRGDFILKYDGQFIPPEKDRYKYIDYVSRKKPGELIVYDVFRDGKYVKISVPVQSRVEAQQRVYRTDLEIDVMELTELDKFELGLQDEKSNVAYIGWKKNGDNKWTRKNFGLIYQINQTPIETIEDFNAYVESYDGEVFVVYYRENENGRMSDNFMLKYNKRAKQQ